MCQHTVAFRQNYLDFHPPDCIKLRHLIRQSSAIRHHRLVRGADMSREVDIKLDMIRVYFNLRIADCSSEESYDDKLGLHIFQLNCKGNPTTVNVSREFIDEHSPAEILATLMRLRPESYIQGLKTGQINITNDGVNVVRSEI
jgi:hypothetical protein